jgi:hypothetical protein
MSRALFGVRGTGRLATAVSTGAMALLALTGSGGGATPAPSRHLPESPHGATARCNDGNYSFSADRATTCAGRGGVARWY